MKIGFIYYTFYPVTGGASVHGFNLARELHKLGYELYKINGDPDPYTQKLKNPVLGVFWILANCDLIYIRMDYFLNLRNLVSLFSLMSRKKIIVEINSPSDELHLFGRSERYIRYADRIMSGILKRANAVITVSDPLRKYCEQALGLKNVHVIENGGEVFEDTDQTVSNEVKQRLSEIKKRYSKIVIWSGSLNEMQDLSNLEKIAEKQNQTAVILIIKENLQEKDFSTSSSNFFIFRNLPRDDVKYLIANSDIGLALYKDYPWSRWGFYNSSLKIFEYLNNGLLTITNTRGTDIQRSYPNFRQVKSTGEMLRMIESYSPQTVGIPELRTWSDVARETSEIIEQVTNV